MSFLVDNELLVISYVDESYILERNVITKRVHSGESVVGEQRKV